jgi:hypothetical protein
MDLSFKGGTDPSHRERGRRRSGVRGAWENLGSGSARSTRREVHTGHTLSPSTGWALLPSAWCLARCWAAPRLPGLPTRTAHPSVWQSASPRTSPTQGAIALEVVDKRVWSLRWKQSQSLCRQERIQRRNRSGDLCKPQIAVRKDVYVLRLAAGLYQRPIAVPPSVGLLG